MQYYLNGLKNIFEFSGRARRAEYWNFILINTLATYGLYFLVSLLNSTFLLVVVSLYALATAIAGLSLVVRRLHDVGKSGWFYFITLIPFIGAIWMFILLIKDSDYSINEYGACPK